MKAYTVDHVIDRDEYAAAIAPETFEQWQERVELEVWKRHLSEHEPTPPSIYARCAKDFEEWGSSKDPYHLVWSGFFLFYRCPKCLAAQEGEGE